MVSRASVREKENIFPSLTAISVFCARLSERVDQKAVFYEKISDGHHGALTSHRHDSCDQTSYGSLQVFQGVRCRGHAFSHLEPVPRSLRVNSRAAMAVITSYLSA